MSDKAPEPTLEFAFEIVLFFRDRRRFGPLTSGGVVGYVGIESGTVSGPRLSGCVVPNSGGDWARIRSDGVVEHNAHYLLEADDGTLIHLHNTGYGRAAAEPLELGNEFKPDELNVHYFRETPRFDAPEGKHDWLSRTILVATGQRRREPDRTEFRYYILT